MELSVKKIKVTIDDNVILNDISFDVNQGDIIAIIGPNGHGKSTILKSIINHYSLKIDGKILLDKKNIVNLSPDEITNLGIFYCSQNPIEIHGITQLDLYKSILNVKNNKPLKISEMYIKISKNLKKLGFDESILERYVNVGFSGGEKKKNEIVQMLLMNPEIILLDEIDSGLDIDTFNNIIDIIKEEIQLKKSVILVSHNHELIKKLNPNKVILIANGQIVKIGDINLANEIFTKGFKKYFIEQNISINKKERINSLGSCGANHGKVKKNK